MRAREEYRYNRLTWAEMNEAIGEQKLILLPTGSTEQHGRQPAHANHLASLSKKGSHFELARPHRHYV